jgi:uncharacterized protein (DUF433 family)
LQAVTLVLLYLNFLITLLFLIGINMEKLNRITINPEIMGGKPCIRGLRVTVGTIVGLIAAGNNVEQVLKLYPYLEAEDIQQALNYAAWRVEEKEIPFDFK